MTDKEPDRPGQLLLDDAICDTINRMIREWSITEYEVVGVLTIIAARFAHQSIRHEGDLDE